jgi:hypothetical protein
MWLTNVCTRTAKSKETRNEERRFLLPVMRDVSWGTQYDENYSKTLKLLAKASLGKELLIKPDMIVEKERF